MAPPKLEINEEQVRGLASIMCTNEEMALILGCSADTLERRYAGAIREGRSHATASLKRRLFEMAKTGHFGALVWLTKNYCGMSDHFKGVIETPLPPGQESKLDAALEAVNALVQSVKEFKEAPTPPSTTMLRLQKDAGVIN